LRWKLFPFSLIERAEQWYTRMMRNMSGDWEVLQVDFCYSFSLTERMYSLPIDILDFEQLEESIAAAWARLSCLLASSPDLSMSDDVSLDIFCLGLDMKSALDLDVAAGGSFAHKTPTEGTPPIGIRVEACESLNSQIRVFTFHIPRFIC
jgi:hypothetical protein